VIAVAISHRLFFALQPLEAEQRHIGRHRNGLEGVRDPVINKRLHLTLAVTDLYERFPAEAAQKLHKLGAAIFGEPVALSLERLAASKESVALRPVRPTRELRALHKSLAEPMAREALLMPGYRFSPHVTLGYRKGKPFAWPIEPIAWESHEFVLIHSEVGATRHYPLGRWPLAWRQGRLF
jgi:RNA 2',3'-cyclic 3'-phosphodiesterase